MSAASRLLHGTDETPLAGCPGCRAPLIATMVYPGAEFICLECGRKCSFLAPVRLEPNAENMARYEALQTEWDDHQADLIIPRSWQQDCSRCTPRREENYHHLHATDGERARDKAAREWIASRTHRRTATA